MEAAPAGSTDKPVRRTGWAFSLALVLSVVLGFVVFMVAFVLQTRTHSSDAPVTVLKDVTAVVCGSLVVVAIWSVLYFAFVRTRAPERGLPHLLILLGVVSALNGFFGTALFFSDRQKLAERQRAETEAAIAEIQTALRHSNLEHFSIQLHTRSPGDAGVLARITKRYVLTLGKDAQTLEDQLHRIHPPQGSDLLTPLGIAAARAWTADSEKAIGAYWTERDWHLYAYRLDIAQSAVSAATREAALTAFDSASKESAPDRQYERMLGYSVFKELHAANNSAERLWQLRQAGAPRARLEQELFSLNSHLERMKADGEAFDLRLRLLRQAGTST